MFKALIEDTLDALGEIDRNYVLDQVSLALDALPFDYRSAIAYGAVGLGAYTFAWLLYRLVTEPKRAKQALLNSTESAFYTMLKEAAHPFAVYPKVAVSSVFTSKSISLSRKKKALREMAPLRFDYAICDENFNVLAAIDFRHRKRYHPAPVRRGIRYKAMITKSANLPFQRFDVGRPPDKELLREWLRLNLPGPKSAQLETSGENKQPPIK